MSFRKYQALLDLKRAACHLLGDVELNSGPIGISVHEKVTAEPADRIVGWKLGLSDKDWNTLSTTSWQPEGGLTNFFLATCLLLIDRFENPQRGDGFESEWDAFSDTYRSAPRSIRAALMNGFEHGRINSVVSGNIRPKPVDLTTNTVEETVPPLIGLAQGLTAEERAFIANADYGCEVQKHLDALNSLLETKDCRFTGAWFPAEVVELVSHVPDQPGFAGCTALVLLNAIYDGDDCDNASFRWNNNRAAYQVLGSAERQPVLKAFRHLYETLPDWDPFWEGAQVERLRLTDYFPWSQ